MWWSDDGDRGHDEAHFVVLVLVTMKRKDVGNLATTSTFCGIVVDGDGNDNGNGGVGDQCNQICTLMTTLHVQINKCHS